MRTYFKNGSWNVVCDVCGMRHKADQIVRRWDGAMTCRSCYEPRHPQDFIRVRDERVSVPFTRPEADLFVPQTTGTLFSEVVSLVENLSTSAGFTRNIPNLGMYLEPLTPLSHYLGLLKLNEETIGGTGRPEDYPDEKITIVENITYTTGSIASKYVINGQKLNELTLG